MGESAGGRDKAQVEWLYRRHLEQWGRAVLDQRQALFEALQDLARRARQKQYVASGEWEFDRWFTQAHLLLVCIRNVWKVSEALEHLTGSAEIREHLDAFTHLVKPAKEFRDFLEHFDEYAAGKGRYRSALPNPEDLGSISVDSEIGFNSMEYNFGGRSVNLNEATDGAVLLAQTILDKQLVRPD